MSHPVPWMDYLEDLEECMNVSEIQKLPTPETDQNRFDRNEGIAHSLPVYCVDETVCRSLEQQRDALMMALEKVDSGVAYHSSDGSTALQPGVWHEVVTTLASIRQMKEGK